MKRREIKKSRTDVQKLINKNKIELLRRIKKDYPKLIRSIKKNYDGDGNFLLDAGFYENIEDYLSK